MAAHDPAPHGEHHRPKGILKHNPSSDGAELSPPPNHAADAAQELRPSMPRTLTEQELVQQNTERNRGVRRSSSANTPGSHPGSRRQSSAMDVDDPNPRLKWDEANIFHTEQGRGQTQKIDEPKTPFIHNYNPDREDDDMPTDYINPQGVDVDELDMAKRGKPLRKASLTLIEPLDLGEPEDTAMARADSSEKHVIVSNGTDESETNHGEGEEHNMSAEARRKHREFEEKRKRHYEVPMGTLSRDPDDDDDENVRSVPSA